MSEKGYGKMLVEGFVRAVPWAVVFSAAFLVTMGLFLGLLKPEIKKAIAFAQQSAVNTVMHTVLSPDVFPKIKTNTKEAIEYTVKTVDRELMEPHKKVASAKR